jgi:TP901 family phage tail tape measure protein
VASDAALGGVTSLATAVDGITSVVNAYGAEAISAGQASDLMFAAVRGGKTNFDELSRSLYNVIPTAASLNLEFGNVTAALATLTAQGTPTTVATTQLRQLLVELSKEGGEAAKTFERLSGESFAEFVAKGGNLAQALAIMEKGAADSNVRLSDLFSSVEAGNAALGLTGAATAKFASELDAAAKASGATAEAAAIMSDSLEHQEALAVAAKKELLLLIGEALEPAKRKWLELQKAIAETGIEHINEKKAAREVQEAIEGSVIALNELSRETSAFVDENGRLIDSQVAMREAIIQINEAYDTWTGGMDDEAGRAIALAEAERLLAMGFSGTSEQLAKMSLASVDALKAGRLLEESDQERLATLSQLYKSQATVREERVRGNAVILAQADAEREAAASMLEAVEAYNEALAAAQEAADAAAREEFIERFRTLSSVIDEARTPIATLLSAQAELTAAQGEWVTAVVDNSSKIGSISAQLAADLSDDQKRAYQEILGTVAEGSAEWRSAYRALQGDLTESQRAALVAQKADLESSNGAVQSVYTGNAAAAEAAAARIAEANAAISLSYRTAALEIALVKIAEQYGEDALAAQEAYLAIQVGMGMITGEEAEKLLEVARKTDEITEATGRMMDKYLEDGKLTADEAENIANMVALMDENSTRSTDSIIRLAELGYSSMEDLAVGATETKTEFDLATDAVAILDSALQLLPDEVVVRVNLAYSTTGTVPEIPGGQGSDPGAGLPPGAYSVGGFTGAGTNSAVAGIVHRNEYVFDAGTVNRLGVDFLDSLRSGEGAGMGGGDTINIYTQDRSDEAVRSMQQYQRQKQMAARSFR